MMLSQSYFRSSLHWLPAEHADLWAIALLQGASLWTQCWLVLLMALTPHWYWAHHFEPAINMMHLNTFLHCRFHKLMRTTDA